MEVPHAVGASGRSALTDGQGHAGFTGYTDPVGENNLCH
jgi:hypothetical protein